MRVRYGDLIFNCDFAFCDGNYIIFGTNSKELFKARYDHHSEARYNLNKLYKEGYLFVSNLEEYNRHIGCIADIVEYNKCKLSSFEKCED